jgi:hypothetical protein
MHKTVDDKSLDKTVDGEKISIVRERRKLPRRKEKKPKERKNRAMRYYSLSLNRTKAIGLYKNHRCVECIVEN